MAYTHCKQLEDVHFLQICSHGKDVKWHTGTCLYLLNLYFYLTAVIKEQMLYYTHVQQILKVFSMTLNVFDVGNTITRICVSAIFFQKHNYMYMC